MGVMVSESVTLIGSAVEPGSETSEEPEVLPKSQAAAGIMIAATLVVLAGVNALLAPRVQLLSFLQLAGAPPSYAELPLPGAQELGTATKLLSLDQEAPAEEAAEAEEAPADEEAEDAGAAEGDAEEESFLEVARAEDKAPVVGRDKQMDGSEANKEMDGGDEPTDNPEDKEKLEDARYRQQYHRRRTECCLNGGACAAGDAACACPNDFTGARCETKCCSSAGCYAGTVFSNKAFSGMWGSPESDRYLCVSDSDCIKHGKQLCDAVPLCIGIRWETGYKEGVMLMFGDTPLSGAGDARVVTQKGWKILSRNKISCGTGTIDSCGLGYTNTGAPFSGQYTGEKWVSDLGNECADETDCLEKGKLLCNAMYRCIGVEYHPDPKSVVIMFDDSALSSETDRRVAAHNDWKIIRRYHRASCGTGKPCDCLNGGSCPTTNSLGVPGPCTCPEGYFGDRCEAECNECQGAVAQ
jgi:hypothetical protein